MDPIPRGAFTVIKVGWEVETAACKLANLELCVPVLSDTGFEVARGRNNSRLRVSCFCSSSWENFQ
jgi:hypothetical protein